MSFFVPGTVDVPEVEVWVMLLCDINKAAQMGLSFPSVYPRHAILFNNNGHHLLLFLLFNPYKSSMGVCSYK